MKCQFKKTCPNGIITNDSNVELWTQKQILNIFKEVGLFHVSHSISRFKSSYCYLFLSTGNKIIYQCLFIYAETIFLTYKFKNDVSRKILIENKCKNNRKIRFLTLKHYLITKIKINCCKLFFILNSLQSTATARSDNKSILKPPTLISFRFFQPAKHILIISASWSI